MAMKTLRVGTVCQARCLRRTVAGNRDFVLGAVEEMLERELDIICLPEAFTARNVEVRHVCEVAESLEGETVMRAAELARRGKCIIVCPIYTQRLGRYWNSAIVLGPEGNTLLCYDKMYPWPDGDGLTAELGVSPGLEPGVLETARGRLGLALCSDLHFVDAMFGSLAQAIDLLLWPSAFNGGGLVTAAALHLGCSIVTAVRTDAAVIVNPLGRVVARAEGRERFAITDLPWDYLVSHLSALATNGTANRSDALLAEIRRRYSDAVAFEVSSDEDLVWLYAADDAVSMATIARELGLVSRRERARLCAEFRSANLSRDADAQQRE